jgi:predicted esterase
LKLNEFTAISYKEYISEHKDNPDFKGVVLMLHGYGSKDSLELVYLISSFNLRLEIISKTTSSMPFPSISLGSVIQVENALIHH